MAVERFIFSIGPLPTAANDLYALFFSPPRGDTDSVFTEDIRDGLRAAVEAFPDDRLVAAPDLAEQAEALGIPLARLDDGKRDAMIITAYVVAIGEQLVGVRSLIPRLARAGVRLAAATSGIATNALRYAVVSFEGDIDPKRWEVVIAGPPEDEPGFTAYEGRGAIVRLVDAITRGSASASAELPSLALSVETPPPFIASALRIGLGTDLFPRPIALENGEMKVLGDRELAVICALAESIAALAEKGKPETVTFHAAGTEFRATARPFNPAG
ncbi:hypothetical protein [Bradyrhizobium sp.]|jgi:hypothetical protein|uniref:hypothetical protein n=1 Tax=Bradyrhizobium sp. TaxID=376 RepID=UPI002E04E765|nr:hypothetical protein [Bradyrhizobium sp.]